jgi:hypothetical protein
MWSILLPSRHTDEMHDRDPNLAEPSEAPSQLVAQVEELPSLDPADAVKPTSEVLRELDRVLDEG